MNQLQRAIVWLSRITHCRGFGIQSPTDYAFVRYVINEHWLYYAYETTEPEQRDWLRRKLGRLYLRLANWRQPSAMMTDDYDEWWRAGCRNTRRLPQQPDRIELARADIEQHALLAELMKKADKDTLLVVEGIWRDKACWQSLVSNAKVSVSYDLYYCGLLLFDNSRHKTHYVINF